MVELSAARVTAVVLALGVLAAGCVTKGADVAAPPEEDPTPASATSTPFAPPFELVPPEVLVEASEPVLEGQSVAFRATFPAEAHVDVTRVRDALWDFGGVYAVGLTASHAFTSGGLHPVTLTVRDVYDRSASTTLHVSVAQVEAFEGVVRIGDGAADARPPDGTLPHDHVDHVLPVAEGAARLRVTLAFAPDAEGCPQPPLCLPTEANLVLRLLDPSGAKIAESAAGPLPRVLETDVAGPGDHVVRVSGDKGVDVSYNVTALVLFPES